MSGYIGPIPVPQGIQNKETFTATAAQTTFNTNGYTDGAFISVYLNGVRLINGTDYTATNGSDVVLASGAAASDVVDFESFNSFSLVSQTFDNLTTKNPTHEDTDGGRESALSFQGEQSGGEISTLAAIQASHDGTADDQKGDLIFKTNDGSDNNAPTEALRIDSEQNLGLGTNSPDVRLHVTDSQEQLTLSEGGSKGATFDYRSSTGNLNIATNGIDARANPQITLDLNGQLRVGRADDAVMNNALTVDAGNNFKVLGLERTGGVTTGTGELGIHMETNSQTTVVFDDEGSFVFGQAATPSTAAGFTELVRIDNNGRLRIRTGTGNPGSSQAGVRISGVNGDNFFQSSTTATTGYDQYVFINGNGTVGRITTDGTATIFGTSSDYRLKENVTDITDGITRVKQLSPKRFNFIADADKKIDGFIAHEAQAVVPEAVTGTKDGMEDEEYEVAPAELDDNGKIVKESVMGTRSVPKMQGIDQAKIVPLLTAALQEAIAKIETLESENTAIKARLDALEAE
jgi:hypothetical protein